MGGDFYDRMILKSSAIRAEIHEGRLPPMMTVSHLVKVAHFVAFVLKGRFQWCPEHERKDYDGKPGEFRTP